jgi:hypothetical protein
VRDSLAAAATTGRELVTASSAESSTGDDSLAATGSPLSRRPASSLREVAKISATEGRFFSAIKMCDPRNKVGGGYGNSQPLTLNH